MSSGGIRENAGRKKIGVVINTRIDEYLIDQIERCIKGISRADKIRKCLQLGIEHNKNLSDNAFDGCRSAIASFFKTYLRLLSLLTGTENQKIQILNKYLLSFFTSTTPDIDLKSISNETHDNILKELGKFSWSLKEDVILQNTITPDVVGSVIEKIVNQKDTGSYYTPKDTTAYIAQYSIVFSLLCKCESPELAFSFYEQYDEASNVGVLNGEINPVNALAKAINLLDENEKNDVFKKIIKFSILDPTCGTGAFIIAAADIMVELYKLTNMYLHISLNDYIVNLFSNCLFGVDILDSAISLINLRCRLYLYNLGISKGIVENIKFKFYCGDALKQIDKNASINDNAFDWAGVFTEQMIDGGFDCIIGNPPYMELAKIKDQETYKSYYTQKCGNIYAIVFEKALSLLKENSYMGMIVPISIVSTQRMAPLRKILFDTCETVYFANFSDRPSCLFTGVHQKLTIVFLKKTKPMNGCKIYTSSYIHWAKADRLELFKNVHYCRTTKSFIYSNGVAKIGDEVKLGILKKMIENDISLDSLFTIKSGDNNIYLNQRMTFWAKCFTSPEPSNEYKRYSIRENVNNKAVASLLNSSLFYLIWETFSDCWHITQSDLSCIKIPAAFFDNDIQEQLAELENRLEEKLYEKREYVYTKQTDYIYVHRLCYNEISDINTLIAKIYGFSREELEYIQNYNLKYRLNVSARSEDE